MAWFAVLFGIINLVIAYGVTRLYTHAHAHDVPPEAPGAGSRRAMAKPLAGRERDEVSLSRTPTAIQVDATDLKDRDATGRPPSEENRKPAETNVPVPPAISEWQDELQAIGQRVRYARLVGQKHLAKDAAAQLRDLAAMWQRKLDTYLKDTPAAGDADQVEMCLAQIETTISNLDAVSYSDIAATAFDCIEREFAVFERAIRNLRPGKV